MAGFNCERAGRPAGSQSAFCSSLHLAGHHYLLALQAILLMESRSQHGMAEDDRSDIRNQCYYPGLASAVEHTSI